MSQNPKKGMDLISTLKNEEETRQPRKVYKIYKNQESNVSSDINWNEVDDDEEEDTETNKKVQVKESTQKNTVGKLQDLLNENEVEHKRGII